MMPLVTVFGATGRQGGAVVRALLARGGWRVRAVTRAPGGAAARLLGELGATICAADLDRPDSLCAAFAGAQAAFCVTDFWTHRDARREHRQALHLAEAAAAERGLHRLIWSTLEDTRHFYPADGTRFRVLQGAYNVPHMDAKGEANALFIDRGLPVTLLLTSFYWDNLLDPAFAPRRGSDGVLEFALPMGDALLPGIAVEDIGACAAALLEQNEACQRRVGIASDHLAGAQIAGLLAEHLGEPVRWRDVPIDSFAQIPFAGADDLAAMFVFKQASNAQLCAARSVEGTRALHPELRGLRDWLASRPHAGRLAALAQDEASSVQGR